MLLPPWAHTHGPWHNIMCWAWAVVLLFLSKVDTLISTRQEFHRWVQTNDQKSRLRVYTCDYRTIVKLVQSVFKRLVNICYSNSINYSSCVPGKLEHEIQHNYLTQYDSFFTSSPMLCHCQSHILRSFRRAVVIHYTLVLLTYNNNINNLLIYNKLLWFIHFIIFIKC